MGASQAGVQAVTTHANTVPPHALYGDLSGMTRLFLVMQALDAVAQVCEVVQRREDGPGLERAQVRVAHDICRPQRRGRRRGRQLLDDRGATHAQHLDSAWSGAKLPPKSRCSNPPNAPPISLTVVLVIWASQRSSHDEHRELEEPADKLGARLSQWKSNRLLQEAEKRQREGGAPEQQVLPYINTVCDYCRGLLVRYQHSYNNHRMCCMGSV